MDLLTKIMDGSISVYDFMILLEADNSLSGLLQSLIPEEAVDDESHPFWKKCLPRSTLLKYDFSIRQFLINQIGYGETIEERLNIFAVLKGIITWKYPNLKCTNKYHDEYNFVLSTIPRYIGGQGIDKIIQDILDQTNDISPLKIKRQEIKRRILEAFYINADSTHPKWIQGPEWPIVNGKPMKFIFQSKKGEASIYCFEDVESGKRINVIQYM